MACLTLQALERKTARLGAQHDAVGDDVDGQAAFDAADVGRRRGVDAAESHGGDGLRRDLHRADAFLRRQARVGFEAVHGDMKTVGGRRTRDELVDAVAVDENHGPRQRRTLLRSRAASRARQRAAVGGQHDQSHEPSPDQHQSFTVAGRRAWEPFISK